MNTFSFYLIDHFHLSHNQYSWLAAINLYADFLLILPSAILIDRYQARNTMLFFLTLSILMTLVFIDHPCLSSLIIWRIGSGAACSISYCGALKIIDCTYSHQKLSFFCGSLLSASMIGSILSQSPALYLLGWIGLSDTLLVILCFGLLSWMLLAGSYYPTQIPVTRFQMKQNMKLIFTKLDNLTAVLFACLMNFSIVVIGAIWGQIYLTHSFHLTEPQAALATSLMFFGNLLGAPIVGLVSDYWKKRGPIMIFAAILTFILFIVLVNLHHPNPIIVQLIFLGIGCMASSQSVCNAHLVDHSPKNQVGVSVAMMSVYILGSIILFQHIFSYLVTSWINHIVLLVIGGAAIVLACLFTQLESRQKLRFAHQAILDK